MQEVFCEKRGMLPIFESCAEMCSKLHISAQTGKWPFRPMVCLFCKYQNSINTVWFQYQISMK